MDTINEERDEIKRSIILNIFEKNYDQGVKYHLKQPQNKFSKAGLKNLLSTAQESNNSILTYDPLKNRTKVNSMNYNSGFDLNSNIALSKGSKNVMEPNSIGQSLSNNSLKLPSLAKNSVRYDPKKDRYRMLRRKDKNNSSAMKSGNEEEASPFQKFTSRKIKNKYVNGPLSYSHIVTKLNEERSVPIRINFPF